MKSTSNVNIMLVKWHDEIYIKTHRTQYFTQYTQYKIVCLFFKSTSQAQLVWCELLKLLLYSASGQLASDMSGINRPEVFKCLKYNYKN